MRLTPFVRVDDIAFSITPAMLLRRMGPPQRRAVNEVGLEAFDYGRVVFRFQAGGRLEEVTQRVPVLHLGALAVPFRALGAFVRAQDEDAFERAGFVVSPRLGLAFVPAEPDWVTALALHCMPAWCALDRV
jgi:hypothetical protein